MKEWVRARLAQLEADGLLRDPDDSLVRVQLATSGRGIIDASSNDYLGLGTARVSRETLSRVGEAQPGAGASRLVQGTYPEHLELERVLAAWTGFAASLLTSSAFAANLGAIPAVAEAESLIVSDALNHASIVDGCRLARAGVVVTPHLDLQAVEAVLRGRDPRKPAWVVVEALFSMDGDSPDLPALRALCDRYGAGLLLDEAHSLGLFGAQGSGLAAATGVRPDLLAGGLGKAVGSQGGFLASSTDLRTLLWNRARSFVFSTAPSPALCALSLAQVRRAQAADEARGRLHARAAELRSALGALGLPLAPGANGPIVPVVLGSNERAVRAMRVLREHGILAQAIRPPTVPAGAARLRLTCRADWPDDAPARIAQALEIACAS
jgi:8-amino-7-oxononanoate synthase